MSGANGRPGRSAAAEHPPPEESAHGPAADAADVGPPCFAAPPAWCPLLPPHRPDTTRHPPVPCPAPRSATPPPAIFSVPGST